MIEMPGTVYIDGQMNPDLQWPCGLLPVPLFIADDNESLRLELRDRVECWLSKYWQTNCMVMPSGRAAISLVLRYLDIGRGHTVFAPRWSSHCVWDVLGRFGNPTCVCPQNADVVLAVHKYARPTHYRSASGPTVIEDACDALLPRGKIAFPNDGRFGVVSLPKVAGTWTGGVLAIRDEADAVRLRRMRAGIPYNGISRIQGEKRWLSAKGKLRRCEDWAACEYANVHPDLTSLQFLHGNLQWALEANARTISKRLKALLNSPLTAAAERCLETGWLPPVLPVEEMKNMQYPLLKRHLSLSDDGNDPAFRPCYLIPLHFGVDDPHFERACSVFSQPSS
jgi:putative PLP-dependent aminotransferase (TIGR04422 family)